MVTALSSVTRYEVRNTDNTVSSVWSSILDARAAATPDQRVVAVAIR